MSIDYNDFWSVDDASGFAQGKKFTSEKQVRDYFTLENFNFMFGSNREELETQDELDLMADAVIRNKWHCDF